MHTNMSDIELTQILAPTALANLLMPLFPLQPVMVTYFTTSINMKSNVFFFPNRKELISVHNSNMVVFVCLYAFRRMQH